MGARGNKCKISQNYILHMKFSEFLLAFSQFLRNLTFIFPDSHETIFWVLLQMIYTTT